MPLEAIDEPAVLRDIVGEVQSIEPLDDARFAVRIGLATATIGQDAGQLLNMLFGNTSLHDDVVLHDVAFPAGLPRRSAARVTASPACAGASALHRRALTCSALKPQGLPADRLGALAERFARGGIDYIKDDHGLADQDYSRFADRVARLRRRRRARRRRRPGIPRATCPACPATSTAMRAADPLARELGLDCVLLAPLIAGFANMQALAAEFPDIGFFAHPSLGGAARIAPQLLIGTLFRLIGADAVIFPNFGGRFGYSPETCRLLAGNARAPLDGLRAEPARPGRRHDPATHRRNCLTSTARTQCC